MAHATTVRRARPLLGTFVHIEVLGAKDAVPEMHAAIGASFAAIAQVHALMSRQDPGSELSRVNRHALDAPQPLSPHTAAVLRAALEHAAASNGAFDPTARGGGPRAAGAASWRDLEWDGDQQVRFARPLRLDFDGIAKGYAVDQAVEVLKSAGFDEFSVNAGGDLRVGGRRCVQLRHPRGGQAACTIGIEDAAIASSAAFRPGESESTTAHLVDPHAGKHWRGLPGVSVEARTCLDADALTKVVLFATPGQAEAALERVGARALVLAPDPHD